ncbi:MAG TPA: hypothetical protein VN711_00760 [Candidatus Saccharimonadales bacterium]|nr:hypothetical protein [Candidatus Saccharimonadales bacterium]
MVGIEDFSLNEYQRGFVGGALEELNAASMPAPKPKPRPDGREDHVAVFCWEIGEARKQATLSQIEMAKEGDRSALIELMRKTERNARNQASHLRTPSEQDAYLRRADTALGIRRYVGRGIS